MRKQNTKILNIKYLIFLLGFIFLVFPTPKTNGAIIGYGVCLGWDSKINDLTCYESTKWADACLEQNLPSGFKLIKGYGNINDCIIEKSDILEKGFCAVTSNAFKTAKCYSALTEDCANPKWGKVTQTGFKTFGECQKFLENNPLDTQKKWQPIAPTLQINIPTLQPFTTKGMEKADAEGNIYIPFIGQYIAGIYRWLVLIAGLVAAVMVIIGGFIYMTAGGNAQRTQQGKDRISHALFGLLLLLGSYILLYTINPDLVRFKSLKVKVIQRIELADNPEKMKDPSDAPPCTGPNNPSQSSGIGDTTYLGQLDNLACGTRNLNEIKFIVIHEGGRNTASTVKIFKENSVSSHYSIDRDGKMFQLVGEEKRARHAGGINAYSIGIDLAIAPDCPISGKSDKCIYTDEQFAALEKLINNISGRVPAIYKLNNNIIGHCQVKETDHTDPRNFDWNKIGLNNSAHYENPNDLTSKCKIVFNLEEYKKSSKSSPSTGCCFYNKSDIREADDKNSCKLGTFYEVSCAKPVCCFKSSNLIISLKSCLIGKGSAPDSLLPTCP